MLHYTLLFRCYCCTLQEAGRITKDGWLVVTSDKTRKQMLNQADCLDKIRVLVRNASKKPYEPTAEDMKVLQARYADIVIRQD